VTGVASTTQVDLVRSIGADDVIDNTREDVTDGVRRWDLILDTAGRRSPSQLRRALTPKGTLIIVGGEGAGRWMGGFDRQLRAPVLSRFVGHRLRMLASTERPEDLQTLRELLEAGTLTPRVGRTYTRHITAGPAVSLTVPGRGRAARGGRVCASSCCAAR
jgi:NADPH:quinone reductase-like Zn-dependent oxidoreductase